ncbi:MAG: T9SS type A sorting domain-containing protein [Elusimicrobia bacterium]|nr:T9SS type A sorting domain-containing protein [Elusimicrobiota bacterium]
MNFIFGTFLALSTLLSATLRADTWTQVNTDGFGVAGSSAAERGVSFVDPADSKTYAYFGTENQGLGAGVFRSSDGVTWNQVNADGFDAGPASTSTVWIGSFTASGGVPALYAGVFHVGSGRVYRSLGGSNASQWSVVFSSDTTGALATDIGATAWAAFNGALYVGTENPPAGATIWKSTSADSIASWIQVSTTGFGAPGVAARVNDLKSFNGQLYASAGCSHTTTPCGSLWTSTGTSVSTAKDTWTEVLVASTTFDATLKTIGVTALESHNGYFYAATLRSGGGAQLWRSAAPATGTWTQLFTPDGDGTTRFSVSGSSEVRALASINGILYAGTSGAPGAGLLVYRSTDGVSWTPTNAAGFGTATNAYAGGLVGLGSFAYVSVAHPAVGAGVWRSSAAVPTAGTLTAAAIGVSSITWTWTAGTNAVAYELFSSTGGSISGLLPSTTFTFTQTFLSTNTVYTNSIVAVSPTYRSTSTAVARYTHANPPSGTAITAVYGSSITVTWALNTNPGGSSFRINYGVAGGSTNTATAVGTTGTLTTLLGASTYFINVAGLNGDGIASAPDVTVSTVTNPVYVSVSTITLSSATITLSINMPGGVLYATVPQGSFQQAVAAALFLPASVPATNASAAANLVPLGVAFQFDLNPGVQPLYPVRLSMPYLAADVPAGVDPAKLLLARYDPTRGVWVPLASSVDSANRRVNALTPHLSLFQLMAVVPPGEISSMKIFPNPLRPAMGQTIMTFSNLPSEARIRIYTVLGELVKDIPAGPAGIASWDATNQSGMGVASGVYFALVTGGGSSKTYTLAVER